MKKYASVLLMKLLILIILISTAAFAQVQVDAITQSTADTSPQTFSHTVSGSSRLLIVGISLEDGATDKRVSSVTYKGVALSRVGEITTSGGGPRADVWSLVNPPTGANNVVVTLLQNNKYRIGAISFINVHQTTPISGVVTGQGSPGSPSLVVSSTSDDLVMDVVASLASSLTVGSLQTSRWNADMGGSGKMGASSTEPGANSVTMSWTGSEKWAGVAFSINREELTPVELTAFSASIKNKTVQLSWQTATEVNNYGFEIERSLIPTPSQGEGTLTWDKIGFVNGHGNSNSTKDYSFEDSKLTHTSYLYRLKQVDTDGTYSYSNSVSVSLNQLPSNFALDQNYPNPFNPSTKICWQLPVSSWQTLKVYDILGNEVVTLVNEFREAGFYEMGFDGSQFSSGVYIYNIRAGNFSETKKMILNK